MPADPPGANPPSDDAPSLQGALPAQASDALDAQRAAPPRPGAAKVSTPPRPRVATESATSSTAGETAAPAPAKDEALSVEPLRAKNAAQQTVRGPLRATLVGIGDARDGEEAESAPSLLSTQRRLAEPITLPSDAPQQSPPDGPIDPDQSGQTIARPPTPPPKPHEPPPGDSAPKVVIDAPGAVRVGADNNVPTSISLRRFQPHPDAATVDFEPPRTQVDPARRARGGVLVVVVVALCAALAVVAVIVALVRRQPERESTVAAHGKGTTSASDETLPTSKTSAPTKSMPTSLQSAAPTTDASASPVASASTNAPVPKGFGRLTVEAAGKSAPSGALVWIGDKSYGPLGSQIVAPCGYRWLFAGFADPKGRLSTRLSKSVSTFVQCGNGSDTHFKLTLK